MLKKIQELLNNMQIKQCPICNCNKLWFKEYRHISGNTYNVLFKCDRCAYVNTTLPNHSTINISLPHKTKVYDELNIFLRTDGYDKPATYLIGYSYWFSNDKLIKDTVQCPFCNSPSKIYNINPFVRHPNDYRVDISCKCKNNHIIAFGVHLSLNSYKTLLLNYKRN